jgi:hypothetical protein
VVEAKRVKRAAAPEIPAALSPVAAALSGEDGVTVEKGWGSSGAVLKHRGKMFVLLLPEEPVFKLPKARVDALVNASVGRRFDPRKDGRLMKEWIVVPRGDSDWVALAREAYCFAAR